MNGLMSTEDVAAMFGVTRRSVARWQNGHLRFPRPCSSGPMTSGGPVCNLYRRSEIEAWGSLAGRWDDVVGIAIKSVRPKRSHCGCCKVAM
jgi:predicted DNA-binding transcriptional regulator AlpA